MEKYLPSIISIAGVALTMIVSLWLGLAKQRTENKSTYSSIDATFRDDLQANIDSLQKQLESKEAQIRTRDDKLEKRDQQILDLQKVVAEQLGKLTDLTLQVKQHEYELKEKDIIIIQLKAELDKFNKKVYYIREITKSTDEEPNES